MDRASDSGSECWGFESLRAYHVGASVISLAPTYFISQSALILLLLLSKSQPLTLGCDLVLGANLAATSSIRFRCSKKEAPAKQVLLFGVPPPARRPHPSAFECSGSAKPPLRNSPLRSEFTPQKRRGPEGPFWARLASMNTAGNYVDIHTLPTSQARIGYKVYPSFFS